MNATLNPTTRTISVGNFDYHYDEKAFCNEGSYDFHHRVWKGRSPRAFIFHDAGFILAIVFSEYFAYSEQDALDEAVDSGHLDRFAVSPTELPDYQQGTDSEGNPEYEGISYLGNASEPFDIESLGMLTVDPTLFATDPLIAAIIADNPEE